MTKVDDKDFPKVSKDELVAQTKKMHEEHRKEDPYFVDGAVLRVVGRDVFVWDSLSREQLSKIREALFIVRMSLG